MARSTIADATPWIISLLGLYWFASSFFLAKRSLAQTSGCDDAEHLLRDILGLPEPLVEKLRARGVLSKTKHPREGCWMPRQVDSAMIIVVDALRFDFALYNLPRSFGTRLPQYYSSDRIKSSESLQLHGNSTSKLLQFVADPPTVTMQRLKALTTGGLPTFADISNNFGGGTVDDDSWVQLLQNTPWQDRGLSSPSRAAFVGDDTWHDLFPTQFAEAYPYPSFNTRDLDTVDNGCSKHIPDLLPRLRKSNSEDDDALEVLVVHFLGVDHVGHTYGPHNQHMDRKLKQMDDALVQLLDFVDNSSESCHAAYIFGDHGMTSDGNHGGGTDEEVTAALFVHFSGGCRKSLNQSSVLESTRHSELVQDVFASIHQIDMVPSLSMLLGLPIPFASLGSVSPSLLAGASVSETTTALALNAGQVWKYFSYYSDTVNKLPNLSALETSLLAAAQAYREALEQNAADGQADDDTYMQASVLFKIFLDEALDLGQRVWTRFDTSGMAMGILVLAIGLLFSITPLRKKVLSSLHKLPISQRPEVALSAIFLFFQCGMLTFSNSYILEEEHTAMYCLGVLSLTVAARQRQEGNKSWIYVLLLPVASRLSELLVSGHGLDPSTGQYLAHRTFMFLTSLAALALARIQIYKRGGTVSLEQAVVDCLALLSMAISWWEKSSSDSTRNGYRSMGLALAIAALSGSWLLISSCRWQKTSGVDQWHLEQLCIEMFAKLLLIIMCVTGPSSSTSLALYAFQVWVVRLLSRESTKSTTSTSLLVVVALWRLITRHVFFATNHGCFFNRLQYSAAFVATEGFNFVTGGMQLFLNTFGYEVLGLLLAFTCRLDDQRESFWRLYGALQLLEALMSCISVSLLRRHLMVWDIYAPHFIWVSVFTLITCVAQVSESILTPTNATKRNVA